MGVWKNKPPLWDTYNSMVQRCHNPRHPRFKDYGQRGIQVCRRWRESFAAFVADMGSKPSPRHTVERERNSRGYMPSNCLWATKRTQARNTRRNRYVLGRPLAVVTGASTTRRYNRVRMRLNRGWSEREACHG